MSWRRLGCCGGPPAAAVGWRQTRQSGASCRWQSSAARNKKLGPAVDSGVCAGGVMCRQRSVAWRCAVAPRWRRARALPHQGAGARGGARRILLSAVARRRVLVGARCAAARLPVQRDVGLLRWRRGVGGGGLEVVAAKGAGRRWRAEGHRASARGGSGVVGPCPSGTIVVGPLAFIRAAQIELWRVSFTAGGIEERPADAVPLADAGWITSRYSSDVPSRGAECDARGAFDTSSGRFLPM